MLAIKRVGERNSTKVDSQTALISKQLRLRFFLGEILQTDYLTRVRRKK